MKFAILDLDDTLIQTHWMGVGKTPSEKVVLVEGAREFLRARKGRLFLISHGDASVQEEKLRRFCLKGYFSKVCVSSGSKRAEFERIIRECSCPSRDIAVVGDRLDSEIRLGNEHGCVTVRMRIPTGKYFNMSPFHLNEVPDHTVTNFYELSDLFLRLGFTYPAT